MPRLRHTVEQILAKLRKETRRIGLCADPQPVPPWEWRTHRHDARWRQSPTNQLLSTRAVRNPPVNYFSLIC